MVLGWKYVEPRSGQGYYKEADQRSEERCTPTSRKRKEGNRNNCKPTEKNRREGTWKEVRRGRSYVTNSHLQYGVARHGQEKRTGESHFGTPPVPPMGRSIAKKWWVDVTRCMRHRGTRSTEGASGVLHGGEELLRPVRYGTDRLS